MICNNTSEDVARGQTQTSSLGAARPLPPSADIGPGGQSVGQAAQFCRRSPLGPYSAPEAQVYRNTGPPFASAPAATRRDLPGHHRRRFRSGTIFLSGTLAGGLTMEFRRCAHFSSASAFSSSYS